MQLGYIGLGKMGSNMVERLLEKKHEVVVYDRDGRPCRLLARQGRAGCALRSRTWPQRFRSPPGLDHGPASGGRRCAGGTGAAACAREIP